MPNAFWIFVAVGSVLLFFMHLAVYKGLFLIFGFSRPVLLLLKIIMIVLGAGFVGAMILAAKYNNIFTRIFYTVTASWYGFLFYLFLAVVVFTVLSMILGYFSNATLAVLLGKGLIFLALLVSVYGLWNAEQIRITRYDILLPNLPASWQGRRAVLVSDLHLGQVHGAEFTQKVVEAVKKENPDIVFIPGDLYDGVKVDEAASIAPFKQIQSPLGVFFVTGNHEEFGDAAHFLEAIEAAGIKVLNNEVADIEGLNVIGVGDNDSIQKAVFENILATIGLEENTPSVLLKHQPAQLDIAEKYGVDLQLSGHTHRAQVWPLSYLTRLIFKGYDYGQKQHGSLSVITSDGVGTWGPPLRVGTKSEIVVLEFK